MIVFTDSFITPNLPLFKRKQRRKGSLGGSDVSETPHTAFYNHGCFPNSAALSRCEGDVFTFDNGETSWQKGTLISVLLTSSLLLPYLGSVM